MARGGGVGARPLEQVEQEHQKQRDDDPKRQISQIVQEAVLSSWAQGPGSGRRHHAPLSIDRAFLAHCQPSKR